MNIFSQNYLYFLRMHFMNYFLFKALCVMGYWFTFQLGICLLYGNLLIVLNFSIRNIRQAKIKKERNYPYKQSLPSWRHNPKINKICRCPYRIIHYQSRYKLSFYLLFIIYIFSFFSQYEIFQKIKTCICDWWKYQRIYCQSAHCAFKLTHVVKISCCYFWQYMAIPYLYARCKPAHTQSQKLQIPLPIKLTLLDNYILQNIHNWQMASETENKLPDIAPLPILGYLFKIGLICIMIRIRSLKQTSCQQKEQKLSINL